MVNFTNFTALPLNPYEPMGILTIIIGVVLVVAAFYIVFKVIKNLVANAVIGGVGLIVLHFVAPFVGITVEISLINIIISLVAGLPGLVVVVLLALLGIS